RDVVEGRVGDVIAWATATAHSLDWLPAARDAAFVTRLHEVPHLEQQRTGHVGGVAPRAPLQRPRVQALDLDLVGRVALALLEFRFGLGAARPCPRQVEAPTRGVLRLV